MSNDLQCDDSDLFAAFLLPGRSDSHINYTYYKILWLP